MIVIHTCKNEEDLIKNEGARVEDLIKNEGARLCDVFSDA